MTSWTKFLHNVNNPILKDLCKFQIDTPINVKVMAVQSFENLHTFICGSHVGGQENADQPIFPYNIIENLQLLFPVTLFSLIQMALNLVEGHVLWSYWPYQNLG